MNSQTDHHINLYDLILTIKKSSSVKISPTIISSKMIDFELLICIKPRTLDIFYLDYFVMIFTFGLFQLSPKKEGRTSVVEQTERNFSSYETTMSLFLKHSLMHYK